MKVEVDEEEDLLAGIVSDMTETGSEAEEEKYIPPKPPGRRQKIIRFLQCVDPEWFPDADPNGSGSTTLDFWPGYNILDLAQIKALLVFNIVFIQIKSFKQNPVTGNHMITSNWVTFNADRSHDMSSVCNIGEISLF